LASRMLPREKRRGACAVYAFCRTADDIVDQAADAAGATAALSRLRTYRAEFERALSQAPADPVLRELMWAMRRFDVPLAAFDTLLRGVERDLTVTRYATWRELQRYCQEVASSVGEMCTAIFGVSGGPRERESAIAHARTLGVAMQLTNILRDVGEDARQRRCYLPDEDLVRFSLRREDVLSGKAVRQSSWTALMAFEIARARELYRDAVPGIMLVRRDAQRCALACAAGYAGILEVIERNEYDTFSRRAIVGPVWRVRILARSWLRLSPEIPSSAPAADGTPRASHAPA